MTIDTGDRAPAFELPASGGGTLSMDDLKGKKVVLYFYPKDKTPGCTAEAEGFRNSMSDFEQAGAVVVGVSRDSVEQHDDFVDTLGLPFKLVSDAEGDLCQRYGVLKEKSLFGMKSGGIERSTFLIDESGVVRNVWRKVKVNGHALEVVDAVKAL
jgi:thioredoxin-dependent peroxiredoxin